MLIIVIFLTFLLRIPIGITFFRSCIPNTYFIMNGMKCVCNNAGVWSDTNCKSISRRQLCQVGQIIWQGCSQCICEEDGQLTCTNSACTDDFNDRFAEISNQGIKVLGTWCTPFRSYYVNCQVCVCPASGRTSRVRCVTDSSCTKSSSSPVFLDYLNSGKNNVCLPKVTYLFPCLHCLCNDDGYFILANCVEICKRPVEKTVFRKCTPKSFYKKDCNICLCPESGFPNDRMCTKNVCKRKLKSLRTKSQSCKPHYFTRPKCRYCNCDGKGQLHLKNCLELDCLKEFSVDYNTDRTRCSPNTIVPICTECFCLKNATTDPKYCSKTCSYSSKLNVLEKVLLDSNRNHGLIHTSLIPKVSLNDVCEANSVYRDRGRFCLCPENGKNSFQICTNLKQTEPVSKDKHSATTKKPKESIEIDLDAPCEPSTFVDFDCNTCFCSKNGKIDPKWCTHDNCEMIRTVQEANKNMNYQEAEEGTKLCNPGSIAKNDCNFCICPPSGLSEERTCTLNKCLDEETPSISQSFTCDPLAYYEVDCNTCYCSSDGLKNVAKCTKHICDNKNSLRSDSCEAGDLFTADCNVCVCPPNGNKNEAACTNHNCSESFATWNKIYTLTENLLSNHHTKDNTNNLNQCFPGEEFTDECHQCVCPDMGLKKYAACFSESCHHNRSMDIFLDWTSPLPIDGRREIDYDFFEKPTTTALREALRTSCTAGSMYIIRCQQCICPNRGPIIQEYCRALPDNFFCEQAFPNFNYLPSARRAEGKSSHSCEVPGLVMDECFICDCTDNKTIHLEKCFKSTATTCGNTSPKFFTENKEY